MATREELLALAAEIEAAPEPSNLLNWKIDAALVPEGVKIRGPNARAPYIASLDAITTLIAEKLPGYTWGVFDDGSAWVWPDSKRDLLKGFSAKAFSPPQGLAAAFLRALASEAP